jgi:hypothetical protein
MYNTNGIHASFESANRRATTCGKYKALCSGNAEISLRMKKWITGIILMDALSDDDGFLCIMDHVIATNISWRDSAVYEYFHRVNNRKQESGFRRLFKI